MASRKQTFDERATKLGIIGFFWGLLGVVALLKRDNVRTPSALEFAMLGLATFRMGRLIAFDRVADPIRAPFTKTVPDESGAGETVVAKGRGPREVIGELLSCPICAGTWVAAGLVYGLQILPGPTRLLMMIMSAIGFAEVVHAATEAMLWLGQSERQEVGKSISDTQ
jgi:hypothetical protein